MMGKGDKAQHNGALVVTAARVAFYRKGFFGEVLETIPLKSITSIERKSLLGHRSIRLHTSGDSLEFKTYEKAQEQELVEAIEAGRASSNTPAESASANFAVMLKQLGELKETGVLTEDEFNTKKAELLSRL